MFYKVNGLSLITEPNGTIVALTGSDQTFKWSLNLTAEEKTKKIKAVLLPSETGPDGRRYLIYIIREPSGEEKIWRMNHTAVARRLFWTGDLSRNYHVSFLLTNVQHNDSGEYEFQFRVYFSFPRTIERRFTLRVEVWKICVSLYINKNI